MVCCEKNRAKIFARGFVSFFFYISLRSFSFFFFCRRDTGFENPLDACFGNFHRHLARYFCFNYMCVASSVINSSYKQKSINVEGEIYRWEYRFHLSCVFLYRFEQRIVEFALAVGGCLINRRPSYKRRVSNREIRRFARIIGTTTTSRLGASCSSAWSR